MNKQYQKTKEQIKTYGLPRFQQVVLTLLVEISLIFSAVALTTQSAYAAVTLNAADLAIVGYNSDSNSDDVALIALADISSGTVLFITDRGWDTNAGTFTVPVTSGETTITWTSPAISAGTIVNANSLPGTASGFFTELGFAGDQVLIYQTDDDTVDGTPTIIYAFNNQVSTSVPNTTGQWQSGVLSNETTESNLPAGTTEVISAGDAGNAFGLMGEVDNLVYTGSITATDKATWLSRIHTPGNWTTDNSTPQDIASGGTNLPTSVPVGNLDTTAPVLSLPADITTNNDAGLCGANVNYNVTATDDGGNATVSSDPASGSFFAVGDTAVAATATDPSGNSSQGGFNVTVSDTEPPTVVAHQDLEIVLDSNGEFTISLEFVQDNAFVSRSDNCGMNNNQLPQSGPGTYTCDHLGTHPGVLFSLDVNGNRTRSAITFNVTDPLGVCNSAPTITSSATASVPENQTSAIDVQATDDNDSEGVGLTFSLSGGADQTLFNIDTSAGVVSFIFPPNFESPVDADANNIYNIEVTVTDSGGLTAIQDIVVSVTDVVEDTTPPTANPVLDPSPNAAGWNNSDVTITWNWSDEGGSGINTDLCDTSNFVDLEGSTQRVSLCSDLANNQRRISVIVNLDKTAPKTIITANPPTTSTTGDASFEFIGSDAHSGVSGFECTLDNGVLAGTSPCTNPQSYTALANGTYTFTVSAIDLAGNVDPTPASYTWTVDVPLSCAPGTYIANPGDVSCTPASPGFFVATANATEQTACAVGTFSANPGAISCTPASPGSFVAEEGSATQIACSLGTFSANAGSTSCTVAEIAFYVDSEGAVASIACPVNTTTTSKGSTDISDCIPINAAPVLDAIGNQTVDEGQLLEFTVSASDSDIGDTLTFQLGNPPTGATLTNNGDGTATFSWTPDFTQAGNYIDVLFTVTDNGVPVKADMETITITVGDVNRPPQFDVLGSQNSDEGVELSFNVQATDPDGNTITLAVSNSPSGAVFTDNGNGNGTLTWTPDFGQAGNYTVMFTATDDGAPVQSDTLDVTITIGNVNQPPVLSMIGDRTVVEDELLEIILTGSDPDGDNLSYSVSNLPTGASFNDNGDGTATFSWIPDFGQAGSFPNVLFTLADNGVPIETVSETISIMVNPGELEPFASCGGFEVFKTAEGDFIAPGFDGEVIVGSNGHDSLIGTDNSDLILGRGGADDIFGKKGDDVICGGRGADFIKGQRGDDTLYGQRGQDELFGGRGGDKLFGGKGDDELFGNQGADTLNGGNGDDFCRGGRGRDTLTKC